MSTISISKTYNDSALLSAVDLDPIADNLITFLNTTKLNDDNIQDSGIDASNKLLTGSLETAKLVSNSVTNAKINDAAVTTAKINDAAVTTAKINDAAVTTTKINDAAVTNAKLASANIVTSSSSGSFSTGTTGIGVFVPITNLSVSITTTGRPVLINLIPNSSGSNIGRPDDGTVTIKIKRDSTTIALAAEADLDIDEQNFSFNTFIDQPSAGTYTYSVEASLYFLFGGSGTLYATNIRLTAIEL